MSDRMSERTLESVTEEVIAVLKDMTSDWDIDAFDGGIGPDTRLVADLTFESIEIVQLMVALEQHFKLKRLASEKLLMRDGTYVPDQRVGDIAAFLVTELAAS
jgi:acyl carrier protein